MRPSEFIARTRSKVTLNRMVALGIKYIPLAATILLTTHIALLLLGVYEPYTVGLGAVLLVALLFLLSSRFDFCKLHRSLIGYMGIVTVCIVVQKLQGFGRTLTFFRVLMLIIGIALITWAFIKGSKDECGK